MRYRVLTEVCGIHDATPRALVQRSLRGKLTLGGFDHGKGVLEQIVAASERMRFVSIDLDDVSRAQPFLDACTETLSIQAVCFRFVRGFKETRRLS